MNKTEFANCLVEKAGLLKKDAIKVVDVIFSVDSENLGIIAEGIKNGDPLNLIGFGGFTVKETSARKGVNPKLLKELKEQGIPEAEAKERAQVDIAEGKRIGFKPGKGLKGLFK